MRYILLSSSNIPIFIPRSYRMAIAKTLCLRSLNSFVNKGNGSALVPFTSFPCGVTLSFSAIERASASTGFVSFETSSKGVFDTDAHGFSVDGSTKRLVILLSSFSTRLLGVTRSSKSFFRIFGIPCERPSACVSFRCRRWVGTFVCLTCTPIDANAKSISSELYSIVFASIVKILYLTSL